MGRVVRWTGGLLGACLLALTTTLGLIRHFQDAPQVMLLTAWRDGHTRLAIFLPGMVAPRLVSPPFYYIAYDGPTPDDAGVSFIAQVRPTLAEGPVIGPYLRWDMADGTRQLADSTVQGGYVWTPDGQWLIYAEFQRRQAVNLWRVRRDGTGRQNLTQNSIPAITVGLFRPPLVSPNGQWILFTTRALAPERYEIYRVPVDGSTAPELITGAIESPAQTVFWPANEWAVADIGGRLYWISPDGSTIRPLLRDDDRRYFVQAWLPQSGLLIITDLNRNHSAVRPGETTPVWTLDGYVSPIWPTPDEAWLIIGREQGRLERLRPHAKSPLTWLNINNSTPILTDNLGNLYPLDPTGQWVAFTADALVGATLTLQRVHVLTGEVQPITTLDLRGMNGSEVAGWSPDGKWLLVQIFGQAGVRILRIEAATGHIEYLTDGRHSDYFVGWGPRLDKKWAAGGLLLLGMGGLIWAGRNTLAKMTRGAT